MKKILGILLATVVYLSGYSVISGKGIIVVNEDEIIPLFRDYKFCKEHRDTFKEAGITSNVCRVIYYGYRVSLFTTIPDGYEPTEDEAKGMYIDMNLFCKNYNKLNAVEKNFITSIYVENYGTMFGTEDHKFFNYVCSDLDGFIESFSDI